MTLHETDAEPEPDVPVEEHAPERVLLATDGGPAALAAERWVAARAARCPLTVTLTHLSHGQSTAGVLEPVPTRAEQVVWQEREYLGELAPAARLRTAVLDGEEALRRAAADADLLVLGTNRINGRPGIPVPSFSTRLAGAPVVPTVLIRRDWTPGRGPVVVGVDEEPEERAVTDFAATEALTLDTGLVVEHVWHLPRERYRASAASSDEQAMRSVAERHVQEILAAVRSRHPRLTARAEVRVGRSAEELASAARGAALLVVGAHLVTPDAQSLLGSVGRAVIDAPPCPVVVVPAGVR